MITLTELENFLSETYDLKNFEDYCINGLVVEGKKEMEKIGLGVSFNMLFLDRAIKSGCDAVIVHHAIFEKNFFSLKGKEKNRIKKLFDNDISLFGIHLPMDAHPDIGHNSLLMEAINADIGDPLKWGFFGFNKKGRTLDEIVTSFHRFIHPEGLDFCSNEKIVNGFNIKTEYGFTILNNGPKIPQKLFIASGGSTDLYEEAVSSGADTFICGEIKEHIPAISLETGTNFINLGHYFSEKPGVMALKNILSKSFEIECEFIEISNPV